MANLKRPIEIHSDEVEPDCVEQVAKVACLAPPSGPFGSFLPELWSVVAKFLPMTEQILHLGRVCKATRVYLYPLKGHEAEFSPAEWGSWVCLQWRRRSNPQPMKRADYGPAPTVGDLISITHLGTLAVASEQGAHWANVHQTNVCSLVVSSTRRGLSVRGGPHWNALLCRLVDLRLCLTWPLSHSGEDPIVPFTNLRHLTIEVEVPSHISHSGIHPHGVSEIVSQMPSLTYLSISGLRAWMGWDGLLGLTQLKTLRAYQVDESIFYTAARLTTIVELMIELAQTGIPLFTPLFCRNRLERGLPSLRQLCIINEERVPVTFDATDGIWRYGGKPF